MGKMTKEDWEKASEQCSLFSACYLRCDDYEISLKEMRIKYRIVVAMYVNGYIKGEWLTKPNEHEEAKFFYRKKSQAITGSLRKEYQSINKATKKGLKERGVIDIDARLKEEVEYISLYFPSFSAAKKRLLQVCESIELLDQWDND